MNSRNSYAEFVSTITDMNYQKERLHGKHLLQAALGGHPWKKENVIMSYMRNFTAMQDVLSEVDGWRTYWHYSSIVLNKDMLQLSLGEMRNILQNFYDIANSKKDIEQFYIDSNALKLRFTKEFYSFLLILQSTNQYIETFLRGKNKNSPYANIKKQFSAYKRKIHPAINIRDAIAHDKIIRASWSVSRSLSEQPQSVDFTFNDHDVKNHIEKPKEGKDVKVAEKSIIKFVEDIYTIFCDFYIAYSKDIISINHEIFELVDTYCKWIYIQNETQMRAILSQARLNYPSSEKNQIEAVQYGYMRRMMGLTD